MNENNIFAENTQEQTAPGKKPGHTPSLVMGILSIVLGLLIPLVGEILGIIGITTSMKKREACNTKAALVCSIVGLVVSVANHILGFLLTMSLFV